MKSILLIIVLLIGLSFVSHSEKNCLSNGSGDSGPTRMVIIQGKATILNLPGGELPATSETLIFQKVGCETCYVGARVNSDGNYKVLVGDGKYKIIVRNPSSPEKDWLAPDQERFIDTGSENSPNQVFNFDIRIRVPN
jgi:hypothetical protein